ncbi:MAG: hypothetical protein QM692_03530 [Thermomicrobiales bacterium]
MQRQFRAGILIALALTCITGRTGTAEDASPAPASPVSVVACAAPPRSFASITSVLEETPPATPAATTGGHTVEVGEPASVAERAEIGAVVTEWLACQNDGELLRSWALFSDAYLHRLLSRQGAFPESVYDDWATPQPADEATATLLEITGERRLDDGRLGAIVRIRYASVPMPKQFFFYFTEQDESLVIDGILGEISFSVP